MTKKETIHHIINTWGGENGIINHWTWEQQQKLAEELSKWLMLKKSKEKSE